MDREIVKKAAGLFYECIKDMPVVKKGTKEEDLKVIQIIQKARLKCLEKEWYFILESLLKDSLSEKYPAEKWTNQKIKYKTADYYTENALKLVEANNFPPHELVHEHIIPKKEYIIEECFIWDSDDKKKREVIKKVKSKDEVIELFDKCHWVAVITKDEERAIKLKNDMPEGWETLSEDKKYDEKNRLARYNDTDNKFKIDLVRAKKPILCSGQF